MINIISSKYSFWVQMGIKRFFHCADSDWLVDRVGWLIPSNSIWTESIEMVLNGRLPPVENSPFIQYSFHHKPIVRMSAVNSMWLFSVVLRPKKKKVLLNFLKVLFCYLSVPLEYPLDQNGIGIPSCEERNDTYEISYEGKNRNHPIHSHLNISSFSLSLSFVLSTNHCDCIEKVHRKNRKRSHQWFVGRFLYWLWVLKTYWTKERRWVSTLLEGR